MGANSAIFSATRIRDQRDVVFGSPASGAAPIYNTTSGKFEVRTIEQADVSGLVAALDAKASSSHTHTLSQIADAGSAAGLNTGTTAGAVPVLGSGGKLPSSMLPALAITDTFVVASHSAMLALSSAETGDVAVRTDQGKSYILRGSNPATLGDWQELLTPTAPIQTVNGQTGNVELNGENLWTVMFGGTYVTDALEYLNDNKADGAAVGSVWDEINNSLWPAIYDRAAASHTHTPSEVGLGNVANVDQRNASNLTSGTVPNARLGTSGTRDATTFYRGDGVLSDTLVGSASKLAFRSNVTDSGTMGIVFAHHTLDTVQKSGILSAAHSSGWGRATLHLCTNNTTGGSTIGVADSRIAILPSGEVGIGTVTPTAPLHVAGSTLRVATSRTPVSASAPGNAGDICWDPTYVYVCTATNTWRRIAHATW